MKIRGSSIDSIPRGAVITAIPGTIHNIVSRIIELQNNTMNIHGCTF